MPELGGEAEQPEHQQCDARSLGLGEDAVVVDRVVVVARVTGRGRASGIDTISRGASVWMLRDRQVSRLTLYQTREYALKAVGLQE